MSRLKMLAIGAVTLVLGFAISPASAQTLTATGPCPGTKTFTVTGGAPFTRYAFIHAANPGAWVVPGSMICAGTVTGLAGPVTMAGFVSANGVGMASVSTFVPGGACGNRYLQVVDTITCTVSNVILIN